MAEVDTPAPSGAISVIAAPWFAASHTFNRLPASYIDPSWLPTLPHGELVERLRHHPKALRPLSDYLCETLGLDPGFWYDFNAPLSRIALLPTDALTRLNLYLGLCTLTPYLRNTIDRRRVQALKSSLGEEHYRFALKRAPFLTRHPPEAPPPTDSEDYDDHVRRTGLSLLSAVFATEPADFRHRLALKFPQPLGETLCTASPLSPPSTSLIRKLLHEVATPWVSFVN